MSAPSPGDVFTVWIYGPLFEGYFMDPGRSGICGNKPSSAKRSLIEDCAQVVNGLVDAVVPGATARDIGRRGEELLRKVGYFDDQATRVFPLLGHGLGVSVPPFLTGADGDNLRRARILYDLTEVLVSGLPSGTNRPTERKPAAAASTQTSMFTQLPEVIFVK